MPQPATTRLKTFLSSGPAASGLEGLLNSLGLGPATPFSYFNPLGNRGDGLIYLGACQFFSRRGLAPYELSGAAAEGPGSLAMIGGTGAWVSPWVLRVQEKFFFCPAETFPRRRGPPLGVRRGLPQAPENDQERAPRSL